MLAMQLPLVEFLENYIAQDYMTFSSLIKNFR